MSIMVISCNKHDHVPFPKDARQVTEALKGGYPLRFQYNSQRLLTQLSMQFNPGIGPNVFFTYDQQKRPIRETDSASGYYNQYIYLGGKLVRVEKYTNLAGFLGQTSFTYDNRGRIIQKVGDATYYDYANYEYYGNSQNVKRTSYFDGSPTGTAASKGTLTAPTARASVIEEYTYDNKINPYSTIGNFPVIPFWVSDYWILVKYDPIPENNILTQKFYGRTDSTYFKFQEYSFTYGYDGKYPVTLNSSRTLFNPDGSPGWTENKTGGYTYDKLSW